jgi:hypothetical protein
MKRVYGELAINARRSRPYSAQASGLAILPLPAAILCGMPVHNGVLDAGVHLIVKPFTMETLAQKLEEIFRARN